MILIIGSILILLIFWEHAAKKWQSNIRPSIGLDWLLPWIRRFFYIVGSLFANISSFLAWFWKLLSILFDNIWTYLSGFFHEFFISATDLLVPLFKILYSWLYIFKGYTFTAHSYQYPLLVVTGSTIIAIIVTFVSLVLMHKFGYTNDLTLDAYTQYKKFGF